MSNSDSDMEVDYSACNKNQEIVERELTYIQEMRCWQWGPQRSIKYKRHIQSEYFNIVKKLIASGGELCAGAPRMSVTLLQTYKRTMSRTFFVCLRSRSSRRPLKASLTAAKKSRSTPGSSRCRPHSDKVCVDCGKFWEPPIAEVGSTYLTLNHKTKKWIKAELVEATPEGSFHLVASRHSQTFIVGAEYLVHPEPPPCLLRVGSRALAILNRTAETGEITRGRGAYQLGVVAEHPTAANRFRWRHRPKLVNTTLVF
jgi:hypothetical protein